MTSPEQAAHAATTLRAHLGDPAWLQLIDISASRDASHFVRVHVAQLTPEVRAAIPERIEGVDVWVGAL